MGRTNTKVEEVKVEEEVLPVLEEKVDPPQIQVQITPKEEEEIVPVLESVEDVEQLLQWKKVGGGSFYLGNKIIKPGEKFYAKASEIPKNYRDVVIMITSPEEANTVKYVPVIYTLEPGEEANTFFVVDSLGKKLSEKALNKEIAMQFIAALQA